MYMLMQKSDNWKWEDLGLFMLQVCSFAIFGNFEVNRNCHFWLLLDSIITDENVPEMEKKSDLSSL